jgi:hypothetical protein
LGFRRSTKQTDRKAWFSIPKEEVKQQLIAHSMNELIGTNLPENSFSSFSSFPLPKEKNEINEVNEVNGDVSPDLHSEAKAPTSKLSNQSNLSNPTILGSEGEKGEFLGDIEKDTHPAPSLKQDGQLEQKEEEEITKPHPFFKSTKEIRHPFGSRIPESSELYLAERYYDLHPDIPKLFFVKDIEREFATNFPSFWEAFYDWLKGPNGKEKTGKQNNLDNPERSFGPTPAHGICEYCGKEKEIWLDKHGRWACSGCLKEGK